MKIQVGANDGETITIDLKKIDSSTLKLTSFNVNGKGAVDNAKATEADLTAAGFSQSAVVSGNSTGLNLLLLPLMQQQLPMCWLALVAAALLAVMLAQTMG